MRAKRQIILHVRKDSEKLLSQLKAVKGVLAVSQDKGFYTVDVEKENFINEELAQLVIDNSYGLVELKEKSFSLEDVFIRLTEQ